MRVLLTGGQGQLGSHLGHFLLNVCECRVGGLEEVDLKKPATLRTALTNFKPDLIVNTAAYTDVDGAEKNREHAFAVNALAPGVMADWCAANGAAMIHFSTDYVYDGSGIRPHFEDSEPRPINVYGESKLAGDQAIASSGIPHLILRTSWIYSAVGSNFLVTMLRLGATQEQLSVVSDQIGAPTSAELVASTTAGIIEQIHDIGIKGFFGKANLVHCAASGQTSWHGFSEAIFAGARLRGVQLRVKEVTPISSVEYPTPAIRPANSRLSLKRLKDNYAIEMPDWRDELDNVLDKIFGLR